MQTCWSEKGKDYNGNIMKEILGNKGKLMLENRQTGI